uniref:Uncharacterized protein n=1 Tax=Octactis speculum TaxID=3111310 RepID=A0A7S2DEU6_9STRA
MDASPPPNLTPTESPRYSRTDLEILVTNDEEAFVKFAGTGTRAWIPLCQIGGLASSEGNANGSNWRDEVQWQLTDLMRRLLASMPPASAPPFPSVAHSSAGGWEGGAGSPIIFRGLLDARDLASITSVAHDCLVGGWGTVRRRSVGFGEAGVVSTPSQTHLRLTRHFRELAPVAWAKVASAVRVADVALGTGLPKFAAEHAVESERERDGVSPSSSGECTEVMERCFKQADFLVYHGASADWVGWHDHAGESLCFAVVLVDYQNSCTGGEFLYRDLITGAEVDPKLRGGDVVICPSPMEHCVRPLTAGNRVSMNMDFWCVQEDRRSVHDRY